MLCVLRVVCWPYFSLGVFMCVCVCVCVSTCMSKLAYQSSTEFGRLAVPSCTVPTKLSTSIDLFNINDSLVVPQPITAVLSDSADSCRSSFFFRNYRAAQRRSNSFEKRLHFVINRRNYKSPLRAHNHCLLIGGVLLLLTKSKLLHVHSKTTKGIETQQKYAQGWTTKVNRYYVGG